MNPLVSIVIPYNVDRGYLQEARKSALKQNYPNCEVILYQSKGKLGFNVNRGVERAKGEYIKILAEDDLLFKTSIKDLVQGIGDADFCCADAFNQVENGNDFIFKSKVQSLEDCLLRNSIHGGTVLYKRSLWDELGGWDEELNTGEEYDWHLKLLYTGKKLVYTPKTVTIYRIWSKGKASTLATNADRKNYIKYMIKSRYNQ